MLQRLIDWIIEYGTESRKKKLAVELVLFVLIIAPLTVFFVFGYLRSQEYLTDLTFARRESLAQVASTILQEKFDRLIDVGVSLATRVQFGKLVREGKWEEAVRILEGVPQDFAYIDRIFLADPRGILMADVPARSAVRGTDFSFRDWYAGVIRTGKPYISEVYTRAAEPQYNVVAAAIPIYDDAKNLLAILVLQVRLDTIFNWTRDIRVGAGEIVYFVDRNGHAAGHPNFSSQGPIPDFSGLRAVQEALRGETEVDIYYDAAAGAEMLVAHAPIPRYGWGVLVQQPVATAFAARDNALRTTVAVYAVIAAFILFIAYFIILHLGDSIFEYHQRQKIFLKSIGDGIVAIDRYWNITLWSDAAEKITGWTEKEVIGRPFRTIVRLVRERDRTENIAFIEQAMLNGETGFLEDRTVLIRKDGSEVPISDSASPIFDQSGVVAGAIIIFRDASRERQLEASRYEFNSLASHQLRGPVTVIKGYAEMLLDKKDISPDEKERLGEIYKAAVSMHELVNALLNVSRMELGTVAVEPEPLYIPDAADAALNELAPEIQRKRLSIAKEYDKSVPPISADPKLVQAVFRNLLSNAVKYTPQNGAVTVGIKREGADMLITVADTGIGIPVADYAKVFIKFFRAENAQHAKAEGTGLGLYLVKAVLEQAGGKIWFKSEENRGTTFFVSLPLSGMKKRDGLKGLA